MTLICSVEGSTGWKYEWFRRTSDSDEEMVLADGNGMTSSALHKQASTGAGEDEETQFSSQSKVMCLALR